MISVKVSEKEDLTVISIRGHACYAPPGKDIVCASVSSLFYALLTTANVVMSEEEPGKAYIVMTPNPTLTKMFKNGIANIIKEFPGCVTWAK